jgi:riboflavin synthase
MFTGLVESVGEVIALESLLSGYRLRVRTDLAGELAPGDSIAVNGVCLTTTRAGAGRWEAEIGPETSRVTNLGMLGSGSLVNLERPMRADARFGGHFVQGHVDATGLIEQVRSDAEFWWFTVGFPDLLTPYLIPKGSIAVDGISLTVAALGERRFDVQIIPYTWDHTNLRRSQPGDLVNLECDMLGKYVVRVAELAGLSLKGRFGSLPEGGTVGGADRTG